MRKWLYKNSYLFISKKKKKISNKRIKETLECALINENIKKKNCENNNNISGNPFNNVNYEDLGNNLFGLNFPW